MRMVPQKETPEKTTFMLRIHDLPRGKQLHPLGNTEEEARKALEEFSPDEVRALLSGERVTAYSHSNFKFSIVRWEPPVIRWAKILGYIAAMGIIIAFRWEVILALLFFDSDTSPIIVLVIVLGAPLLLFQTVKMTVAFVRKRIQSRQRHAGSDDDEGTLPH